MKKTAVVVALIIFTGLAAATTATYTGQTEKQGPEAEYIVGVASDQQMTIELRVDEVEGLEIDYNKSIMFNPDDSEKVFQRGGETLGLREMTLNITSVNVSRQRYVIPVTLRAYSETSSEATRPQVIHERDYSFEYVTDLSSDFGFDGSLIDREDSQEEIDEPDETLNITEGSEENTLTNGNTTDSQGEENRSGPGTTTYLLMAGIVVLTLYIVREAFT